MPEQPAASPYDEFERYSRDGSYRGVDPRSGSVAPEVRPRRRSGSAQSSERGLPGWLAVVVLLVIAGIGGIIDQVSGASIQGAFNIGLVIASIIAILIVRRHQMFPVVIAPPLVYFIASAGKLYISSNGLKNRGALTDAASNWLVYGFPAIAAATAAVLVIAGIRMIIRR